MKQTATAKILSLFESHRQITIKTIRANFPELTCESVRSGIARMIHDGRLEVAYRDSKRRCHYRKGPRTPPSNDVVDQCRKNWAGYRIHKIFGSSRGVGNRV